MRRLLLISFLGLAWGGACDDDGALVIDGGAGTGPAAGGSGASQAGNGGDAGVPASDIVSVGEGHFTQGQPPTTSGADALPQIVSLRGPAAVTNGGTALLHVEVSPAVASPRFVVGLQGDSGYHTVTGVDPEGDGIYDIAVHVAAGAAQGSLVLSVALIDDAGNVGAYHELEIQLLPSGTGDVKVTLSFDRLHDLDLHVREPSGEEIYYDHPASSSGGQLDLDSGARCQPPAANAENVFWPPGGAPPGQYRVSVQNYEQCSAGDIAFTVRVEYDGVVNTYTGNFPDGSAGEAPTTSNVREIATFTRGQ